MRQTGFFDDIIVDSFAGGGGASTGIELATGRTVDIAINHDESAISMHRMNHPYTEHYREDIWKVDPKTVCRGRHVRLAWFSPDCKHFSRAKGSPLKDKGIRGLAWVVLRWAGEVRPDIIMLENVPEFTTWGPLKRQKPVKAKAGTTYKKWRGQLEALGYTIETKELVAADYGAPTSRKRFVLIARCDGEQIVFPEPTHGPRNSEAVKSGKLLPYRSAAEVIDWSLPYPSIFDTKEAIKEKYGIRAVRPLKENTLKRVARGTDKFVIKNGKPFIVPIGYGDRPGQAPRISDIDDPVFTVVGANKHFLCEPKLAPAVMCNMTGNAGASVEDAVPTITGGDRVYLQTSVVTPFIAQQKFGNAPQDAEKPLTTVTGVGAHEVVAPKMTPFVASVNHSSDSARGQEIDKPFHTVTAKNGEGIVTPMIAPFISQRNGNGNDGRGRSVEEPVHTTTATNHTHVAAPFLAQYFGNSKDLSVEDPKPTITTLDREAICVAHITKYFGGVTGVSVDGPMPTVTGIDHNALQTAHIAEFKGQDIGQDVERPLRTITASAGEFGLVVTRIEKYDPNTVNLGRWANVRELLNKYQGYNLADDEVLLLNIGGIDYYISDIGLRMFTPRELYDVQGFPHDYIIDHDIDGKPISREDQVARCGNSVCPPMAAACVRANLPEYATDKIHDMKTLHRVQSS